jgi:hypothetical protein
MCGGRRRRSLALLSLLAGAALSGFASADARASQIISTSTVTGVKLGVNSKGEAMVTYTSGGKLVHVLAWGAVNTSGAGNGSFTLQYDGGYKKYYVQSSTAQAALARLRAMQAQLKKVLASGDKAARDALAAKIAAQWAQIAKLRTAATDYWKTFSCPGYDGPPLPMQSSTFKAPDGSYWAVQQWSRVGASVEVHLAHWTGALPTLTVDYGENQLFAHVCGAFTYDGTGVSGTGVDVRRVYIDSLPAGGQWKHEIGLRTNQDGSFCHTFVKSEGEQFRATVIGPGVTPDATWQSPGSG